MMVKPASLRSPSVEMRESRDPANLASLEAAIRQNGFLGVILVRKLADGTYEVVWGETRRLAAIRAGVEQVPVQVTDRELTESDILMLQLQENELRRDYRPLEKFAALRRLQELNGWSNAELARQVKLSAGEVTKAMCILDGLAESLRQFVGKEIPVTSAYQLSRLGEPKQLELGEKIVKGLLTRDALEDVVAGLMGKKAKRPKPVKVKAGCMVAVFNAASTDAIREALDALYDGLKRLEKNNLPLESLAHLMKA